mmetsp:Transcript_55862/g.155755  ORF Transcript_55862/g.155755 Transcript_55862/m.155755 type:complete len:287 (-) Transcript_55862:266-1126(-)
MPLFDVLFAWLCDARHLDGLANAGRELRLRARQEWQPRETEEYHSRDPELVQPEAKAHEPGERAVGAAFPECIDWVHAVAVLQSVLDETCPAPHHCPILPESHGRRILEAARDKADVSPFSHACLKAFLGQRLDVSMHIAQDLKVRVVVPQHLVDEVHCVEPSVLMKILAPNALHAKTNSEDPVRVEAKQGAALLNVGECTTKLARGVVSLGHVSDAIPEPRAGLEVPEPSDPGREGQPHPRHPVPREAAVDHMPRAREGEQCETRKSPSLAASPMFHRHGTEDGK